MVAFDCVAAAVSLWFELHQSSNVVSFQSSRLSRQTEDEVDCTKRYVSELYLSFSC